MSNRGQSISWKVFPGAIAGTLVLLLSAVICPINNYAAAIMLMSCAVLVYFYCVLVQSDKNWWDIRAVFSAIWLMTNGLAALRLTGYQVLWETETWICQALAYAAAHIGAEIGDVLGDGFYRWVQKRTSPKKGRVLLKLHTERLFWICVAVTLMGIFAFVMNVLSKGFIPFFTSGGGNEYYDFYTKWYIFSVAGTMISGLCYYVLKTQKLSVWKKIFLWVSIVYSTFLFPTLVVNRGCMLTAALSLTTAVFYLNKRRFGALILCVIVIAGAFVIGTKARGYTEAQLNVFFEPIQIGGNKETEPTETDPTETDPTETDPTETAPTETDPTETAPTETTPIETQPDASDPGTSEQDGFQLSGTASFVYSYLTVSHDNFNEAVRYTSEWTYGVRQLRPFNVILRSSAIDGVLANAPYYMVRNHLNTVNLIGDAYYDFGVIGTFGLTLLWFVIFGAIQKFLRKTQGVFSLLALGNVMTPVALCFFTPWVSQFSFWMHWGLVLLMFLAAYLSVEKKNR